MSEEKKSPRLSELFWLFLRLGATAFGGLAIIEYFRRFAVKQKDWLDDESYNYGIAISQAVPGPPLLDRLAHEAERRERHAHGPRPGEPMDHHRHTHRRHAQPGYPGVKEGHGNC